MIGRRLPTTPKSQIKNALRQIWLRSRERAAALKRDNYSCQICGKKQSVAKGREVKVHVHHINEIDWDGVVELIIDRLLPDPSELKTYCKECHVEEHRKEKGIR